MTGTSLTYRKPPRRLSQVLRQLAETSAGPVTVEMIRDALGDRSFAALLVFCALLNLLPLPPGSTLLFGPPLILITVQMIAGHQTVWLPRSWLRRSVGLERFRSMIDRLAPQLERLERLVKPRRWPFESATTSDRVIGVIGLVLAIAVTLPIPLGNWLPAFAVAIIGLSLSERDGVFLALGTAVGVISLLIIASVIGAAGALAALLFGWA
ncbi:MAG: exopolysaccharide biosynthesis protein [Brucellaceae bacterium]|nr:exopolysaccharide biosynthesis protein [Brucellaceae bacterium]